VHKVNTLIHIGKDKLSEEMEAVYAQQRMLKQTFFKNFSSEQMFVIFFAIVLWLTLYMAFILIGVTSFLSRANISSTIVSGVVNLFALPSCRPLHLSTRHIFSLLRPRPPAHHLMMRSQRSYSNVFHVLEPGK
jgi:hypothetical protein